MKKTKTIVLVLLLALLPASCKKEERNHISSESISFDESNVVNVSYAVNGNITSVVLRNSQEINNLIRLISMLAQEGYDVWITGTDRTSEHSYATKDVVRFETKDAKEFEEWMKKMLKDNYTVYPSYDKETGIYTGTAVKE